MRAARGRNWTLRRVLGLARRIDGMRMLPSLDLLADEFGVSTRTIRRDLYALEQAGWPMPQFRHFPRHVMEIREAMA